MNMPKPLRNFIFMVLASIMIFLLLASLDEYEDVIAPLMRIGTGQ